MKGYQVHKFWRVAAYEYQRHVLRKRFLFALLSVPGLVIVMVAVGLLISQARQNDKPLGYVDHSGLLASPLPIGFNVCLKIDVAN